MGILQPLSIRGILNLTSPQRSRRPLVSLCTPWFVAWKFRHIACMLPYWHLDKVAKVRNICGLAPLIIPSSWWFINSVKSVFLVTDPYSIDHLLSLHLLQVFSFTRNQTFTVLLGKSCIFASISLRLVRFLLLRPPGLFKPSTLLLHKSVFGMKNIMFLIVFSQISNNAIYTYFIFL